MTTPATRVSLEDVEANFEHYISRVEAGESIEIIRHNKVAAKLVLPEKPLKKIDIDALRTLRDQLPYQHESAGDFIRKMRDSDRY